MGKAEKFALRSCLLLPDFTDTGVWQPQRWLGITGTLGNDSLSCWRRGVSMISAKEAISRLKLGNAEFISAMQKDEQSLAIPVPDPGKVPAQKPFAVILSCADSRVPPEVIFQQGCGQLFVQRVAGHVVDDFMRESVLFGCDGLGSRLILVLGHRDCGAVKATLAMADPEAEEIPYLDQVRAEIQPAVEDLQRSYVDGSGSERTEVINDAVAKHVQATVEKVRNFCTSGSDDLQVVGAVFDIASGEVLFLD